MINQPIQIVQKAAFGELSYRPLRDLKVTAGVRRYEYRTNETTVENGISTPSGGPSNYITAARSANAGTNPKFDLSYTLGKDLLLYTIAAKGFRPGAGNQPVPLSGPQQCSAGPGNLQSLGLSNIAYSGDHDRLFRPNVTEHSARSAL